MVIVVVALVAGGLVGMLHLRRRRKAVFAGLNADRPVFSVDPPRRGMGDRKHEAL